MLISSYLIELSRAWTLRLPVSADSLLRISIGAESANHEVDGRIAKRRGLTVIGKPIASRASREGGHTTVCLEGDWRKFATSALV